VIAENIYAQIDAEGRIYMLMDSIIDHRKDKNAVPKDVEYGVGNGKRSQEKTTDGWKLNIQWKDCSTNWDHIKTLKNANLVEIADYIIANKIASKPAFVCWVLFTIQKRDRIIAAVNKWYLSRTHKLQILLPKTVAEALDLDKNSGTTHWQEAINLQAKSVDVVFQDMEEDEHAPVGYQFVKCHMIFDVKAQASSRKQDMLQAAT
jgi:hypothetical protein